VRKRQVSIEARYRVLLEALFFARLIAGSSYDHMNVAIALMASRNAAAWSK